MEKILKNILRNLARIDDMMVTYIQIVSINLLKEENHHIRLRPGMVRLSLINLFIECIGLPEKVSPESIIPLTKTYE